jgi:hypothetical protein
MALDKPKPTTSKAQNDSKKDLNQEKAQKELKDEIEKSDKGELLMIFQLVCRRCRDLTKWSSKRE